MKLYLIRHAIAENRAPSDRDRSLTQAGIKQANQVAQGLKRLDIPVDLIVTSPYLRAIQTGEQIAKVFGTDIAIQPLEALTPEARPKEASQALGSLAAHEHVIFIGHEPNLSTWLGVLVAGADILRCEIGKVSVACVVIEQVPPQVHQGTLQWLMTAEQLSLIGKCQ